MTRSIDLYTTITTQSVRGDDIFQLRHSLFIDRNDIVQEVITYPLRKYLKKSGQKNKEAYIVSTYSNDMKKFDEIAYILSQIDSSELISEFFFSILTENEIKMISSRWELVKMLYKGDSQRKIAKELNLSLCKITRGSKELKKKNSVLKKVLEQHYIKL